MPAFISALNAHFWEKALKSIIGHFLSIICPFANWNSRKIDEDLKQDWCKDE